MNLHQDHKRLAHTPARQRRPRLPADAKLALHRAWFGIAAVYTASWLVVLAAVFS